MDSIDNGMDVIDSRDVIMRIEELQQLKDDYLEAYDTWAEEKQEFLDDEEHKEEIFNEIEPDPLDYMTEEEGDELVGLNKLEEEAERYSEDWRHGVSLIRESYFTEYTEELCKDIGDISKDLPWYINAHIDWEGVAEEIKQDYTEVDFDGVTYFVR